MHTTKRDVLVVEDEPLVALFLEDMLVELGHKVVGLAPTLSAGLEAIRDLPVSLAILDVSLHGELSFPIAREANARGIPVLFVTGFGQGSMPELQQAIVLAKPYTSEDLARAVEAAIQAGSALA